MIVSDLLEHIEFFPDAIEYKDCTTGKSDIIAVKQGTSYAPYYEFLDEFGDYEVFDWSLTKNPFDDDDPTIILHIEI